MKRKPLLKSLLLALLLTPISPNFSLLTAHCSLLPAPSPLFSLSLDETLSALAPLSENSKAQFRWDPLLHDGVFNMGDHSGSFSTASREGETGFLLFNNRELFNVPLPYNENGALNFPEAFVVTLQDAFAKSFENDSSRFHVTTIIIDAGHGGKDPGAVGRHNLNGKNTQVAEKDIVLKTALMLRNMLNQTYPDKRILMTRSTDIFQSLEYRSDMANAVNVKDNEAVIFISIHANASINPQARGYEVWHITTSHRRSLIDATQHSYSPDITAILNAMLEEEYTSQSIILADFILSGLRQELGSSVPSRGRKANDWFVVRNSRMPAVLVELGFVSNREDAILMTSDEGLQKLTRALYNGIKDSIDIFER
jgi:N-acetylmuramoyl-L-alanine amidase